MKFENKLNCENLLSVINKCATVLPSIIGGKFADRGIGHNWIFSISKDPLMYNKSYSRPIETILKSKKKQ